MSALIKRTVIAALTLGAASGGVVAQQAAQGGAVSGGVGVEEVIVTAQKRAESVQDVPLSITTLSPAALEQREVNTFFDYASKVPNLSFALTGDGIGTARSIALRGIAGTDTTGFYIDDVPLPDSIDPRVLDVDRIEVLRGPQGTLYGARSMGGTVRVITRNPNLSNFEATVHAGLGSTEHTDRPNSTADMVLNMPIVGDRAALRLSAFFDDQAGFLSRSYCTNPAAAGVSCFPLSTSGVSTVRDVAATSTYGGAASLTIKATEDFTITPRFMVQRETYSGFPMADYRSTPGNGYGYPVPSGPYTLPQKLLPSSLTQARLFNIPEGGIDAWDLSSLTLRWAQPWGEFVSSTAYFGRTVWETEDESDFVWAAITSNFPTGSAQPSAIHELKDYQRFVEEIRFASKFDGPFQFVAGAFYSDFHGRLPFSAYYPPAVTPGLDATLGLPPPEVLGYNPAVADLIFASDFHTRQREPAVFGEFSYNILPSVKATVGARWYQVKITSQGYEEGLATGASYFASPFAETKESGTNPKAEIDWHVTPDKMVYALASKGFRPGGLVPIVPPGQANTATDCVAALQAQDPGVNINQTRQFSSDSLWNYEAGFKTSWLEHRVNINAAGFHILWPNIQQPVLLSCGFQFITNAGSAISNGAELEVSARPVQNLDVTLGMGYQDAHINHHGLLPVPDGFPVYNTPDWTGNTSATYTLPLGASGWTLQGTADYSFVGRSFSANNNPAQPRERPSYDLVDLRLAAIHGNYQFALFGKNLGNTITTLGDNRSLAAEVPGRPRLIVNQPRTIGVEGRVSF